MTTVIALDRNPGPKRVDVSGSVPACVVLASLGVEVSLPYDDLDTLTETIALFVEARDKLSAQLIDRFGQEVLAREIRPGWEIAIEGIVVTVSRVLEHGNLIGVSFPPVVPVKVAVRPVGALATVLSEYREFGPQAPIVRIVRPVDQLAETMRP